MCNHRGAESILQQSILQVTSKTSLTQTLVRRGPTPLQASSSSQNSSLRCTHTHTLAKLYAHFKTWHFYERNDNVRITSTRLTMLAKQFEKYATNFTAIGSESSCINLQPSNETCTRVKTITPYYNIHIHRMLLSYGRINFTTINFASNATRNKLPKGWSAGARRLSGPPPPPRTRRCDAHTRGTWLITIARRLTITIRRPRDTFHGTPDLT